MYFCDVLDESKIGKKYRNSWNGKSYEVTKTETGYALNICESLEELCSEMVVTQILIID